MKFEIAEDGKSIKCLACGLTSYHPEDVRTRYCGKCHVFHEDAARQVTKAMGWSDTYLRRVRVEGEE